MTTPRDEQLKNFFGGYFHQDWDMHGASSWEDVVRQFVVDGDEADARRLRDALRSWLEETASEPDRPLSPEYCCDYDPRPDGLSERQWVEKIVAYIDKLIRN